MAEEDSGLGHSGGGQCSTLHPYYEGERLNGSARNHTLIILWTSVSLYPVYHQSLDGE